MDDSRSGDRRRAPVGPARPTMSDVAAVAGVSLKTVSRVVNHEPGVRAETAGRVTEAIRTLGFRPNVVAADFARGAGRSEIGLVIDDVSNPFWAKATRAIEDVATASGRHVITASSDFLPAREHEIIESLVSRRLGGLIIVPVAEDHAYLALELELGTSIVFLDRPQHGLDVDIVVLDDYGGARTAVEHLLRQGHRRVALVSQSEHIYTMRERRRGYLEALRAAGLEPDPDLEIRAETTDEARARTAWLLGQRKRPTAVFCANNRMTVGVIGALGDDRRRVALVGFDDLELAEALAVPLTVVRTDAAELGRAGAELLLKRMGGWDDPPQRLVLPTTLVIRGSGEISP